MWWGGGVLGQSNGVEHWNTSAVTIEIQEVEVRTWPAPEAVAPQWSRTEPRMGVISPERPC